jgi:ATP-binding cassette subfamily F protein uup
VGGYDDWLRQRPTAAAPVSGQARATAPAARRTAPVGTGKRSYKAQRELDALPARIEALEAEQVRLHTRLQDPGLYQTGGEAIADINARLRELDEELEEAYARWEALEAGP